MADPAEIARRLTKAQRALVTQTGRQVTISATDVDELLSMGVFEGDWISPTLTPLGTQVRAIVEQGGGM